MTKKPVRVGVIAKHSYDVFEIGTKGERPKPARGLVTTRVRIAGGTMTTKPVKGISITKDGKVKLVTRYFDASRASRAKKSTKQRVVRKSKP